MEEMLKFVNNFIFTLSIQDNGTLNENNNVNRLQILFNR